MCNHDNLKADNPTVGILREGERIDNIGFGDMKLIQKPEEFCYGVDAVILADFAAGYHKGKTDIVVDLGTGTGVIPLILSYKLDCVKIYGVELQPDSWERACRNAENNGLTDRIEFLNFDVKDIGESWGTELRGNADIVVSNPPYFKSGGAIKNDTAAKTIARHETSAGINDFLASASYLLKPKGELFMIHRPSRLADICWFGRKNNLEPKTMRFVSPKPGAAPNLLLVHMVKGGGNELKLLDPISVYTDDGRYTDEILKAYE